MQRIGLVAAVAVGMLLGFSLQTLAAATARDLATEVSGGRDAGWAAGFESELSSLAASVPVSPAAYGVVLRALSGGSIEGSAQEAARLVFSLCLRADEALRRGTPPGEVLIETRLSVRLPGASRAPAVLRGSAQQRLQRRLAGMGSSISGDLANRRGPQGGPWAQSGGPPEGLPGPPSSPGGGRSKP